MTGTIEQLKDYSVVITLPVLWGDMDALQHVNSVAYFRYFETVRAVYHKRIRMTEMREKTGIGPILATASCIFYKPLKYPDTVRIGCRATKLTDSELDQEYCLYSELLQEVAALGTATIVAYDYNRLRRSTFPPQVIEEVGQMEPHLSGT